MKVHIMKRLLHKCPVCLSLGNERFASNKPTGLQNQTEELEEMNLLTRNFWGLF